MKSLNNLLVFSPQHMRALFRALVVGILCAIYCIGWGSVMRNTEPVLAITFLVSYFMAGLIVSYHTQVFFIWLMRYAYHLNHPQYRTLHVKHH